MQAFEGGGEEMFSKCLIAITIVIANMGNEISSSFFGIMLHYIIVTRVMPKLYI